MNSYLINKVCEKGVVDIINTYKTQMETNEKFKKCLELIPKCRVLEDDYSVVINDNHRILESWSSYIDINGKSVTYWNDNTYLHNGDGETICYDSSHCLQINTFGKKSQYIELKNPEI